MLLKGPARGDVTEFWFETPCKMSAPRILLASSLLAVISLATPALSQDPVHSRKTQLHNSRRAIRSRCQVRTIRAFILIPLSGFNKPMFTFNLKLDDRVLHPAQPVLLDSDMAAASSSRQARSVRGSRPRMAQAKRAAEQAIVIVMLEHRSGRRWNLTEGIGISLLDLDLMTYGRPTRALRGSTFATLRKWPPSR